MQHFELSQLVHRIRRSVAVNFPDPVWVEAEIAQAKQSRGHWYIDLIQKSPDSGDTIAQISAVLWKTAASALEKRRNTELEALLDVGRNLLLEVAVEFHPVYGLKLNIRDIDTSFTEGLLARERAATIAALVEKGLWDLNRAVPLPRVIQRIALISNSTAAGYADLIHQLRENPWGYAFHIILFESALQGQAVGTELPAQMEMIRSRAHEFDAVVIIRGGGSKLDLSAFDGLEVATAIAKCPLPVITGIGHETDETVSDLVACHRLKTPTAVAAYLIDRTQQYEADLITLADRIFHSINQVCASHDQQLIRMAERISAGVHRQLSSAEHRTEQIWKTLMQASTRMSEKAQDRLDTIIGILEASDPGLILSKGFSFLTHNGKLITDPDSLQHGDILVNQLSRGNITSTFEKYETKEK